MRTVCLGDSFTRGFGVKEKENWVSLLNTSSDTFINKGINGDTTGGMLARLNSDVLREKPDYVLIAGGLNDFIVGSGVEIPQTNYMAMVHQAFHNGVIPIVGIQPGFDPDSVREDWSRFADFHSVLKNHQVLRRWLKGFCNTFHLFYIDFYGDFQGCVDGPVKENYYLDGLHLTVQGHKRMAEIVSEKIKTL